VCSVAVSHVKREDPRYVLTSQGLDDLRELPTCQCSQLWVSDGVYVCHECGTIYGVVYGISVLPHQLRRRVQGASS
jgi:transposase InsO family protein